jgi:hypothetical protein
MYENARYATSFTGQVCCIMATINGVEWSVPIDPANTDYAAIMRLVEAGELVIAPASP